MPFLNNDDIFRLKTPILDVDEAAHGTAYVTRDLTVPEGIIVEAFGNIVADQVQIAPLSASDGLASTTASPLGMGDGAKWRCLTNTSGQVETSNADSSGICRITTEGWRVFW